MHQEKGYLDGFGHELGVGKAGLFSHGSDYGILG